MKRWWMVAAIVLVVPAGIFAQSATGAPASSPTGRPLRIVSLAPSVTEMLFELGVGGRIVGATDFCNYPPEAQAIPRVGGLGQPNIEKLLSLAPDIVIATDIERRDIPEMLRRSGIRVLELRISNFAEMFAALQQMGDAVGEPERAAREVEKMKTDLEQIAKQYAGIPQDKLPRVFIEIWSDPLLTAGGSSFLDEVVARAGGINVAHGLEKDYPTINPEKVVEWNPDVILLCYMTIPENAVSRIAGRIGWGGLKAIRDRRIIADISSDYLLRPGPRLIEGVKRLAERLHGTTTGKGLPPVKDTPGR